MTRPILVDMLTVRLVALVKRDESKFVILNCLDRIVLLTDQNTGTDASHGFSCDAESTPWKRVIIILVVVVT